MNNTVAREQRHTRALPCRICGGHEQMPRGREVRCAGFRSEDGEWEYCERVDGVKLNENTTPPTYAHKLYGRCPCGQEHNPERPGASDSRNGHHAQPRPRRLYSDILRTLTGGARLVKCWPYHDTDGQFVYQVARYDRTVPGEAKPTKTYLPWQPVDGQWACDERGLTRVLYRLPELLAADPNATVFVPEGEGCADALSERGQVATCNPGGALKWNTVPGAAEALRGRHVVVLPDNDPELPDKPAESRKGQRHAEQVAADVYPLAASVRVLMLPDLPPKGDVADWLAAGGTPEQLAALVASTPLWMPPKTEESGTTGGNREQGGSRQKASGGAATDGATAIPWPKPLADVAYYGVLGTIARETEPYIEADSAALLINLIETAGVAMGRGPYLQVGAGQHTADYAATVGESGDNKADGWWPIAVMLDQVTAKVEADAPGDRIPLRPQRTGGLSTGEGALQLVRDARSEWHRDKGTGEWVEEEVDPGVKDKRLLVVEGEFSRVLAVMGRHDNTLSQVLRQLHDGEREARSSPKVNAIVATEPHVGLIGMITPNELNRKLHEVELFNGFANRFMWVLTHRIQSLPKPPPYTGEIVQRHASAFSRAIARACAVGLVTRNEDADAIWEAVYEPLRRGDGKRKGMAREVCARAHTHVLRIALTFAALDGSSVIIAAHLRAALAIWNYLEACAVYLFSNASGSPIADVIYDALVERGALTRTQISQLFSRHVTTAQIQGALDSLLADGRAHKREEETPGRTREVWEAVKG